MAARVGEHRGRTTPAFVAALARIAVHGGLGWDEVDNLVRRKLITPADGAEVLHQAAALRAAADAPVGPVRPISGGRFAPTPRHEDPLFDLSPHWFVPILIGREAASRGDLHKFVCPFHGGGAERHASFVAYPKPIGRGGGVACFGGCGGWGGDIYDLGARLEYGVEHARQLAPRDFVALRAWLDGKLGIRREVAS